MQQQLPFTPPPFQEFFLPLKLAASFKNEIFGGKYLKINKLSSSSDPPLLKQKFREKCLS